ncbi:MAG: tRNA 4-thiouridine(8) synthase ThiI [Archaeoglobi archaeon]|nr:tRNA 4-thiouridine(8) synthase ThiI [Candidatus Mnemosynella bozhongmuii]
MRSEGESLIIARYSEVALKSPYVRREWERALIRDIREKCGAEARIKAGRIFIRGAKPECLRRVFGIVSFSPCIETALEELKDRILEFSAERIRGKSFALRVKRTGNHPFTSLDVARELGAELLRRVPGSSVNLDEPDVEIFIEIRDDKCYIYDEIIPGIGGLPRGVSGKLVSLFSGGIDSPVATFLMMKRGCEIIPLYIKNGFTGEDSLERAREVAEILKSYQPDFELIVSDVSERFRELLKSASERGAEKYACVLCKRLMYREAERIAREFGALGIVTGESIGQVASQTLDNLLVISSATSLPVYRPLIGMDKIEIERIAREIGTFEISSKSTEPCRAVPRKPATRSRIERILEIERAAGESE